LPIHRKAKLVRESRENTNLTNGRYRTRIFVKSGFFVSFLFPAVCMVAGLTSGCAATPPSPSQRIATYISTALAGDPPARIVVVPFASPVSQPEAGQTVTQAVARAMQGALCCDLVSPAPGDERLAAESVLWQSGRVDVDSLVVAQKAYLADAFLFGSVTQYKPYDPPVLGVKLRMLSARTGDLIWAAEALFDSHEADVRSMAARYFEHSGLKDRLYGPDLILMSPKLYAGFVVSEMVRPLAAQLQHKHRASQAGLEGEDRLHAKM
jgi:hypothetical protein